ncbi:MAG: hypothetical protein ACREYE_09555 [Gammaproteobacteria bacterium]
MKKSAALWISHFDGARDPHVFHDTLRSLVSSLRLAPAGLALRRNATSLRSQRFFTTSETCSELP